jgi:alpha-beta hydrolase superfamily lysophospholipase
VAREPSARERIQEIMAHHPHLPPALPAERREITGQSGRLSYYVAGGGRPLLLVHSINAACSAYEVRPIFERMQAGRRVFAVDLPGFGFSDRSARRYEVPLFVAAINDMLDTIAAEEGPEPVDALALSRCPASSWREWRSSAPTTFAASPW